MEKLKSIFKLKFIQEMPRENKMAYLISVAMGIGASILITIIPSFCFFSYGTGFENNIFAFSFFVPVPILSIILLLILFNKFPVVWENIKTRMICIVILSIVYMYGFCFILLVTGGDRIYKVFFLPIFIFFGIMGWLFTNLFQTPSLTVLFFLSIFIISATYLTTKGIENLVKRIVLFFIIGLLIFISAITPLIIMYVH